MLLLSLLVTLSAHAAEKPVINFPSDAIISDVECNTVATMMTKTESGWSPWSNVETRDVSVMGNWNKDGFDYSVEDSAEWMVFEKSKREAIDDVTVKTTRELDQWELVDGSWEKITQVIERISRKEDGFYRVIDNKVNGVSAPYYWDIYSTQISDKKFVMTNIHKNPSARNTELKKYSRFFTSCLFTDR